MDGPYNENEEKEKSEGKELDVAIVHPTQLQTVVVEQPGLRENIWSPNNDWMPPMGGVTGCPPGLEFIATTDRLLCRQYVRVLEILGLWEHNNKYALKNSRGRQLYIAVEKSSACMRMCCKQMRSYTYFIVDENHREVMRIVRPLKCGGCCWCASCSWCSQETAAYLPDGTLLGSVHQLQSGCTFLLKLTDGANNHRLNVEGTACCPCGVVDFQISDPDGTVLGVIRKEWAGCAVECCTMADRFTMEFPLDLDVAMKATIIASMFLIEMTLFEYQQRSYGSG